MVLGEEHLGFQGHPLSSPHRSPVVRTTRLPAMRLLALIGACCLLAVALAAEVKKPAAAAAPGTAEKLSPKAATLAERSAGLAFSLYQAMAKDQAVENILLSPVVVASSLGLVSLGGKAATASQAKAVLSAEQLRDEEVHAGLGELLRALSNSTARNVTWKLGSRLYGPSSVSFAEDFVRSSKQHYNCEHSKINFRDKRSALQSINEWAAQTTDGKLPEVTKDVERTDGALLVNAMFFKRESRGVGRPGTEPSAAGVGSQLGTCCPNARQVPGQRADVAVAEPRVLLKEFSVRWNQPGPDCRELFLIASGSMSRGQRPCPPKRGACTLWTGRWGGGKVSPKD